MQRWHDSITGGSENHAWQYARLLAEKYETDLITTTALNARTWENELPAGEEIIENVKVKRFPVTSGRSPYWEKLYILLVLRYNQLKSQGLLEPSFAGGHPNTLDEYLGWPPALQEELVRAQGPHSEELLEYLQIHGSEYKAVLFLTYLYSPTCFGMSLVDPERILFQPTLHDEPASILPVYGYAAGRARKVLWNTEAEKKLGEGLWGPLPGRIIPMGIKTEPAELTGSEKFPFILYSGRIEIGKGCRELFKYFIRYKKEHGGDLRLLLTGFKGAPIPERQDIEFRGFVSEDEKFRLMAEAKSFIMPSELESLSVVTLEAMAQKTPVLVNGNNPILMEHIHKSKAGAAFTDYSSFVKGLQLLLNHEETRKQFGIGGREYVLRNYDRKKIQVQLIDEIESL